MKKGLIVFTLIMIGCLTILGCATNKTQKPVLYIIGDSTVKNGSGKGADDQWGWGSFMSEKFDTTKIIVLNKAIGGRSSRTFLTEGRWDSIMKTIKPGDFVMMQFGHNDGGALDDTLRARGTIQGIGNESKDIYNPIRKVDETVYTYGWYMRKYVKETQAKGATPIICSPIPRAKFDKEGKINTDKYAAWGKEIAVQEKAYFIPLNDLIIEKYATMDTLSIKKFFPKDHTHTNGAGARLNAEIVVQGMREIPDLKLNKYLKK